MSAALLTERPVEGRPLEGKTCLVTGSSRGIGAGIATDLANNGADVIVNYCSSAEPAHELAEDLAQYDVETLVLGGDVTDLDAVLAMREEVHEALGPIDVLVSNAGITADRKVADMSRADWDRVIGVNLGGAFNVTRTFFDDLATPGGRLVTIGSVIGARGNYGQANYAASKSGLVGFTRSVARELAPYEATANCVAPGYTRTEMVEAVREDIKDRIREGIPLGRFATVPEIASAVRFLVSDEAGYITGEVLNVNGGMDM